MRSPHPPLPARLVEIYVVYHFSQLGEVLGSDRRPSADVVAILDAHDSREGVVLVEAADVFADLRNRKLAGSLIFDELSGAELLEENKGCRRATSLNCERREHACRFSSLRSSWLPSYLFAVHPANRANVSCLVHSEVGISTRDHLATADIAVRHHRS